MCHLIAVTGNLQSKHVLPQSCIILCSCYRAVNPAYTVCSILLRQCWPDTDSIWKFLFFIRTRLDNYMYNNIMYNMYVLCLHCRHVKASSPRFNVLIVLGCLFVYPVPLLSSISLSGDLMPVTSRMIAIPFVCEVRHTPASI